MYKGTFMKKVTKFFFLCLTLSLSTIIHGADKTEKELAESLGKTVRKFWFLFRSHTDKDTQSKVKQSANTQAHTAVPEDQKKSSSLCSPT